MKIHGAERKGVVFDLQGTLLVGSIPHGVSEHSICIPRPELTEGLWLLKRSGVQLGVVTSGSQSEARALLHKEHAADFFEPNDILGKGSWRDQMVKKSSVQKHGGLLGKFGVTKTVTTNGMEPTLIAAKPSAEPLQYLLGKWSLPAHSVVFIGDTVIDNICANRAEIDFLQIPELKGFDDIGLLTFLEANQ